MTHLCWHLHRKPSNSCWECWAWNEVVDWLMFFSLEQNCKNGPKKKKKKVAQNSTEDFFLKSVFCMYSIRTTLNRTWTCPQNAEASGCNVFNTFGKFGLTLKYSCCRDLMSIWTIRIRVCLKSLGTPWLYTGDLHSSYYATSKNNSCTGRVSGVCLRQGCQAYEIFSFSHLSKLG